MKNNLNTAHVTVRGQTICCENCGQTSMVEKAISINALIGRIGNFQQVHVKCKPSKALPT